MITLHQANTAGEYGCENCGRNTKQHYVLQKNELSPKGVCEYCLQNVITQKTAEWFTIDSLQARTIQKEKSNIEVNTIEPIGENDVIEAVEGTFIHECGGVYIKNGMLAELEIDSDSMDSFEDFAMKIAEGDSCIQKVEVEEDDSDEKDVIIEPEYERQRELVQKLDLIRKWDNQSNPGVRSQLINIRREQIIEHTSVTDGELVDGN